MIALVAVALVLLLASIIAVIYSAWSNVEPRKTDPDMRRIALRSVLLLDRALTDPTVRQTKKWEDEAQSIINSYQKKEGI